MNGFTNKEGNGKVENVISLQCQKHFQLWSDFGILSGQSFAHSFRNA